MVTVENTAVSFLGKEQSEELGLTVSVVFFTLFLSISHNPLGKDVSVSRTGQPRKTQSVPGQLDMIAMQVIGHVKIIVGSRCIIAVLQLLEATWKQYCPMGISRLIFLGDQWDKNDC